MDHLVDITTCYVCNSPITLIRNLLQKIPIPTNVYQCQKCEHVSLTPFPISNYLEKLYETKSELVLSFDFVEANKKTASAGLVVNPDTWVSNLVPRYPKGDLLDFGCADGALVDYLCKLKWNAIGVDIASFRTGINFFSRLEEISEPVKFNYVVLQDVLEHLVEPKIVIDGIVQRTHENGLWFISIPTSSSLEFKILKQKWDMISPYGHLHFFSCKSIEKVLTEAGLRILSVKKRRKPTNWSREIKNCSRLCFSIPYSILRMKGMSHLQLRLRALVHSLIFLVSKGDQLEIIAQRN